MTLAPASGFPSDAVLSSPQTPSPSSAGGGSFSWAAGIYAAPRPERTLFQTVASLRAAGWEPTIQAEPGTVVPPASRTVFNAKRLGVVHNFRALATRLLAENPDANFILTVQDDAIFHPDSRVFIEASPWPANAAFVSLYCSRAHSFNYDKSIRDPGINEVTAPYVWGDLALVWPRAFLEEYVRSNLLRNWGGTPGDLQNLARRRARIGANLSPYLRELIRTGAPVSLSAMPAAWPIPIPGGLMSPPGCLLTRRAEPCGLSIPPPSVTSPSIPPSPAIPTTPATATLSAPPTSPARCTNKYFLLVKPGI